MTVTKGPEPAPRPGMLRPVRLDRPTGTSLARGGVLSTVGLLAQGVLRFVTALLIGHVAGKAELGVVASAIAIATTLALLWPTTTGSAASKFLARARGAGNHHEIQAIAAHLSKRTAETSVLLGVISLPVWVLIDHGTWVSALSVAVLTVTFSGYSFTRGVQFGAGQVPRATAWDVTSVVLGLAALATLLVLGVRGPALVLPLVLTYGVYTLACWPHGASGKPERPLRRELDGFVALGAIGTMSSAGFLQLSQIASKLAGGDEDAGQYAAALNLATPAAMLATSISLVLFPSLSEAWGRGDVAAFKAQTDRATRTLALLMVAVFGSIIVCNRLIVGVIWGSKFAGTEDLLPILVVAVLATNLGVGSVNAITTRSQRGMLVTTGASILGMLIGVAVWLLVVPHIGISGVAIGYLCGTFVIAAIPIGVVWKTAGHRWGLLFVKVLAGLAVVGGIVLLQRTAHLPDLLDPVCALAFLAVWGVLNRSEVAKLPIPGRKKSA
ncbi:lipopolysaccharide biosynthesis protein [Labedaea rhizosphaerae]|uniref:Putative peptidoglycan lipid II flippase n=1 Tax=Labedaea rhizosphaerae TaxID=598644 RepID=A0A4R6SJ90_LABRH|nr:lipopolysaccharide biosynthesis protein [Labedaea rhizosphaerae]TDQ04376.1 putative peptidoglycan lipid II flippase [Labedaea rhizosphaerae]